MSSRAAYLHAVLSRYGSISLPMESAPRPAAPKEPEGRTLALRDVYQPLALRSGTRPLKAGAESDAAGDGDSVRDKVYYYLDSDDLYLDDHKPVRALGGEQALARSPSGRMVILGGPGTGKTTLLRALLLRTARAAQDDDQAPLPIFVELPALASHLAQKDGPRPGLRSYLPAVASELGLGSAEAELLTESLAEGRVLVCLDGLDEVPPARRPVLLSFITSLKSAKGAWVLGSRYTQYRSGDLGQGIFAEWELLPLDDHARRLLAAKILRTLSPEPDSPESVERHTARFLGALADHPQAATWKSTPLLFSLTAACWAASGELPSSRAALYQLAAEALMRSRVASSEERQALRALFAQLALELFLEGGRAFSESQIRSALDRLAPGVRAGLPGPMALVGRLSGAGLLEPSGEGALRFGHHTLHEYLVGLALATALLSEEAPARAAWELAWSKRTFSRWSEPLRLMVGVLVHERGERGARKALDWLNALVAQSTSEEGDPGNLLLALVIQSLGEIGAPPASWPEQELSSIDALLLRWTEQLIQNPERSHSDRRPSLHQLARELARVEFRSIEGVIARLSQVLRSDEDARRRNAAAEALGWLDKKAPVAVLAQALSDSSPEVRRSAAAALLPVAASCPVEPLLAALKDRSDSVRESVATLMAELGARAPIPALIELARCTKEAYQEQAMKALAELGARVPIELFIELSTDRSWKVRDLCLGALGKRGDETIRSKLAMEAILHQLTRGDRFGIVASACSAIEALGDRLDPAVWVPSALAALRSKEDSASTVVAETLARLKERAPMTELIAMLQSSDQKEASQAEHALVRLGPWVPIEPLAALLGRPTRGKVALKEAVLRILGRTGERAPVEALIACLKDRNEKVRHAAVRACGKLGERAPIEPLLAATRDKKPSVVTEAYVALARNPSRVPVSVLIAGLPQLDMYALEYVVHGIGRAGGELPLSVLGHLGASCMGAEGQDELSTAEGLMSFAAACTRDEVLLEALRTPDATMRSVAAWILQKKIARRLITMPDIVERLIALQSVEEAPISAPSSRQKEEDDEEEEDDDEEDYDEDGEESGGEYLLRPLAEVTAELLAAFGPAIPDSYLATLRGAAHTAARNDARFAALQGLAQALDPRCIPLLGELATSEDQSQLRTESARQLCRYLASETIPPAAKEPIVSHLERVLSVADAETLELVAEGLAAVGRLPERLVSKLWELAARPGNQMYFADAKTAVLQTLWRSGAEPREQLLLDSLGDDAYLATHAAISWLGSLGDKAPIEALVQRVRKHEGKDSYGAMYGAPARSARAAARTLGMLGKDAPLDPLLVALSGVSWDLREAAASALASIGPRVPLAPILAQLRDKESSKRKYAALALTGRAEPASVEALIATYSDPDPELRRWASAALDSIGEKDPRLLPTAALLQEARNTASPQLTDYQIPETQARAILALRWLGPDLPLDEVEGLLRTGNGAVRAACLQVLATRGEAVPIELVAPYLGDHVPDVRRAALQALLAGGLAVPLGVFTARLHQIEPGSLPLLVARLLREPVGRDFAEARSCLRALLSRKPDHTLRTLLEALSRITQEELPNGSLDGMKDLLLECALCGEPELRAYGLALLRQHDPAGFAALQEQARSELEDQPATGFWQDQQLHGLLARVSALPRLGPEDWEEIKTACASRLALVRLRALELITHATGKQPIPDPLVQLAWRLRKDPHPAVRRQADAVITEVVSKEGAIEDDDGDGDGDGDDGIPRSTS